MEKLFVQIYTQLNELNENVLQPGYRLKEIAHATEGQSIEQHLALVEACLRAVIRQLKAIGEANEVSELVDRQLALATQWRDELLAFAQPLPQTSEHAPH